ncbi:MAG: flagellar basal body L-ring protein FlgH [Planctomycetota bacterium]
MRLFVLFIISLFLILGLTSQASGQELSSSLYSTGDEFFADPFAQELGVTDGPPAPGMQTDDRTLSPAIASKSFMAVSAPEPRRFAIYDLVTIIIREDTQTTFSSSLETEKESEWTGEIAEFPRFNLSDLLDLQVVPNTFPNGTVKLDVSADSSFEGEGDYANKQSMTARIQATIIDVKPNGNVVIEARKSVRSDDEHYTLVATGICRVDDIGVDNSVLSTQIADLFIDKQHDGHLKKAADKGFLTEVMDFLFPW